MAKQVVTLDGGKEVHYQYIREKYGFHRWDFEVYENGELIASACNYNCDSAVVRLAAEQFVREQIGNDLDYQYSIAYSLYDGEVQNSVGCYTLRQAEELAQFICRGYESDGCKVDYVHILDGDRVISRLMID